VKKVVKNNGGSGCLKDLSLVQTIIRAVQSATDLPVSVKIRSGWDETLRDPVGIALRCRDAGAQALTLHAGPVRRCSRARPIGMRSRASSRRWTSP